MNEIRLLLPAARICSEQKILYAPYSIDAIDAPVIARTAYARLLNCCASTAKGSDEGTVSREYITNAITSENKPTKKILKPLSLNACQRFSSIPDWNRIGRLQIKSYRILQTLNSWD